jgi:hypothetical protein
VSGSDILLLVGGTALVAAIVTLFAFQMTAAKIERRLNRRSRILEGPVPGCRSLSTIGLKIESTRGTIPASRRSTRQPAVPVEPANDSRQESEPSTLLASLTPLPAKEARLNSLQTIRSRSASLHTDAQPDQSTGPKLSTLPRAPSAQRLSKRPASDVEPEQGPAAPQAKSRPDKARGADNGPPSSEPTAAAEPTIAPKTPTSKRPKRANGQAERVGSAHRRSDQAPTDVPADLPSLDLLDALQPSDVGGSLSRDSDLPDLLVGLNETDAGIQGLADDLSDIDGGGLPAPTPKTPQKSRR